MKVQCPKCDHIFSNSGLNHMASAERKYGSETTYCGIPTFNVKLVTEVRKVTCNSCKRRMLKSGIMIETEREPQ